MIEELRKKAAELLESGEVKLVIGYGEGPSNGRATPVIVSDHAKVDRLIFDKRCFYNLARYLKRPEIMMRGKAAVVVKGCDARAINVMLLEHQLKRDSVVILGVVCDGVGEPVMDKCASCLANTPPVYDYLFGDEIPNVGWNDRTFAGVEKLEAMSPEERWDFWIGHFDRCIKCYACREACPLCMCTRCITDKNQPQWVPTSPHSEGNLHWNITRAFHLAGRCVGCGECQRACPMDIPLDFLNLKIAKEVYEQFGFQSGLDAETVPPMATFREDDNQEFIG